MKRSEKKRKQKKVVLMFTLATAAVIVGGMTFAWFSSKDQVTNRFSASAKYDVSIVEDFQPPEDWLPGQDVNKDVAAVNTGNVDAFVRMWLEGEMSVVKRTGQNDSVAIPDLGGNVTALTAVTDTRYAGLGFTYSDGDGNYYRELSKVKRDNPSNNATTAQDASEDNKPAEFNEIQAMQAGGYLASVPADAEYYYVLEQATTIEAFATSNATEKTVINLKAGDVVATKGATATPAGVTVAYIAAGTKGISIDTSEFYPQTEGVYLFRRNVSLNATKNTADDYEYSGYYYVPKGGKLINDGEADHYLALYTERKDSDSDRSDYTVPDNAVTAGTAAEPSQETVSVTPSDNMKFYNAKEVVVKNSDLTWAYDSTAGAEKLTATYDGGTAGTTDELKKDDIVIDIALANIGENGQTWKAMTANNKTTTFYYNDDLESGDTTTKLVDKATLSPATTDDAFVAFDFDLNVNLESVQVTMGENGNEKTTPVEQNGQFATNDSLVSAYATPQDVAEITNIKWN